MSSRPPWAATLNVFRHGGPPLRRLAGRAGGERGASLRGRDARIFPTAVTLPAMVRAAPTTAAGVLPPPQPRRPGFAGLLFRPAARLRPAPRPPSPPSVGQCGSAVLTGCGADLGEGNAADVCAGVDCADTDTRFDCFRRERDARGSWEAALPVCAAAEAGTPPTATAGGPAQPQEQFLPEAEEILRLVNEFRSQPRRCGRTSFQAAPPLSLDPLLVQAAFDHSQDMALNNYYAHRSRDGRGPGDRIEATGYSHRGWRENIFAGPKTVERAFQGWVESPGHCANMMSSEMEEMGIAYVRSDSGRWNDYWTMKLARPAD